MKITIEPTTTWVVLESGHVARMWQGTDDAGAPVFAVVASVGVPEQDAGGRPVNHGRFENELVELEAPFAAELRSQGLHLVVEE